MIDTHNANTSIYKKYVTVILSVFQIITCVGSDYNQDLIEAAPGQKINDYIVIGSDATNGIKIYVPDAIEGLTLSPGEITEEKLGRIIIDGDGSWDIFVVADESSGGYLTEYDPIASKYIQNGFRLINPMIIKAQDGREIDLSEGGLLITGSGHQELDIIFKQKTVWGDRTLPQGRIYRLVVSFIASLKIAE